MRAPDLREAPRKRRQSADRGLQALRNRRHHEADDSITYADIAMLKKGGLAQPLLEEDPVDDPFMWVRLIATVTAVSLGSSLQFGFATGSLNNLEQVWRACNFSLSLS